jgi:hypothetical protein
MTTQETQSPPGRALLQIASFFLRRMTWMPDLAVRQVKDLDDAANRSNRHRINVHFYQAVVGNRAARIEKLAIEKRLNVIRLQVKPCTGPTTLLC